MSDEVYLAPCYSVRPRRLSGSALRPAPRKAVARAAVLAAAAVCAGAGPALAQSATTGLTVPSSTQLALAGLDAPFAARKFAAAPPTEAAALDPAVAPQPQEGPAPSPSTAPEAPKAGGLAVQINNPVTDLWLIETEFNNFKLEKDPLSPVSGKWVNNFYFQPVLPVNLTENLSLISRPVIPVYQSVPVPTGPTTSDRKTAFGDIILAQVLSPKVPKPWIVAAGPTWIFPTAGSHVTGQGKWQVGPAVGGGVVTDKYIVAALVQQWWSFAGKDSRASTSQMAILPKVYLFMGDGWSVGYSGQIQVDWKAPHGERWTVPVGLAVGKVVKFGILPVQLRAGAQYIPIRPDFGPKWNLSIQVTPIVPRLIRKPIFD